MVIRNDAWFTLYNKRFDSNRFLYHYTNIDKAAMILHGNSLKFSKVNTMNDTLESKPKVILNGLQQEKTTSLIEHFRITNNQYVQLLCFSRDYPLKEEQVDQVRYCSDYSGRGFAFPRMWAQYASNNNGVCFVFDKAAIFDLIEESVGASLIAYGDVNYIDEFPKIDVNLKVVDKLLNISAKDEVARSLNDADFLKSNRCFVQYNYLSKLKDWEHEREYRYVAYGANDFFVHNISKALCGIIIGEKIKPHNERILQMFCCNTFEIKKVSFFYNGCKLENIYYDYEVDE